MKKLLAIAFLLIGNYSPISDGTLTKKERKFVIDYLESSMENIFQTIEGLTTEQWNYQASADSWSVAGACEHLLIAETRTLQLVSKGIIGNEKNQISPSSDELITDSQLIEKIKDRSPQNRVKTLPSFEPSGLLADPKDFISKFREARSHTIVYAKKSEDALKDYYYRGPAGLQSAYQWLILMSAHAERHHQQMKEVMAHSGFPTD